MSKNTQYIIFAYIRSSNSFQYKIEIMKKLLLIALLLPATFIAGYAQQYSASSNNCITIASDTAISSQKIINVFTLCLMNENWDILSFEFSFFEEDKLYITKNNSSRLDISQLANTHKENIPVNSRVFFDNVYVQINGKRQQIAPFALRVVD